MRNPFSAKAALLQALTTGPGYGLELLERISDRTGDRVRLRLGSLYPALRALQQEGLVRSWDRSRRRGRPRRYYELTIKGIRSAEETSRPSVEGRTCLRPCLIRVPFSTNYESIDCSLRGNYSKGR